MCLCVVFLRRISNNYLHTWRQLHPVTYIEVVWPQGSLFPASTCFFLSFVTVDRTCSWQRRELRLWGIAAQCVRRSKLKIFKLCTEKEKSLPFKQLFKSLTTTTRAATSSCCARLATKVLHWWYESHPCIHPSIHPPDTYRQDKLDHSINADIFGLV